MKTHITFKDTGKKIIVKAKGHTDTRVCAAISFMLQALIHTLVDYGITVDYVLEEGNISMEVSKKALNAYSMESYYHFGFVRKSLLFLAEEYPDYVEMEINSKKGGESK